MIKCTVLYDAPADPDAFERHYHDVHLEISATMPGLRRREIAKGVPGPGGAPAPYYRIAELYFDSREAMEQAFASEQGQRGLADRESFVPEGVTVLWAELDPPS
jgi:uncharacterized protein (TIGR02118 family)